MPGFRRHTPALPRNPQGMGDPSGVGCSTASLNCFIKMSTIYWAWWYMPIILAMWEVQVGESQSEAAPAKKKETVSEKLLKQKGLEV
jgi:hypothetical protein